MSPDSLRPTLPWKRSRYGFVGFCFLSLVVLWFVLRIALFLAFRPAGLPLTDILLAFLSGLADGTCSSPW